MIELKNYQVLTYFFFCFIMFLIRVQEWSIFFYIEFVFLNMGIVHEGYKFTC